MIHGFDSAKRKRLKSGGVYFLYLFISLSGLFLADISAAQVQKTLLKPLIKLSTDKIWQRQQVLLRYELKTDDPFARLEVEPFKQAGFTIIPYDLERVEGKNSTRLILKWAIYPFIAGEQRLQLPRIRYRPNHGRIETLESQTVLLKVRPLPVYVPPTMPVGKIAINKDWQGGRFIHNGELQQWKVTIKGEGVAAQTMPPLSRQIKTSPSLLILPLQHKRDTTKQANGILQQVRYTIPFKATKNGFVSFPSISIQYFEPSSGKLETSTLNMPWVISLSGWLYVLIIGAITLVIILITFLAYQWIRPLFLKRKEQKRVLQQLANANDYQAVRKAMNHLSVLNGWESNPSLAKFAARWTARYGESSELNTIIRQLQAAEFSPKKQSDNEADRIQRLSQNLMKLI